MLITLLKNICFVVKYNCSVIIVFDKYFFAYLFLRKLYNKAAHCYAKDKFF